MKLNISIQTGESIKAFTLYKMEQIMHSMGTSLEDVGLRMTGQEKNMIKQLGEGTNCNYSKRWAIGHALLNLAQRDIYDTVVSEFFQNGCKLKMYYLDGPGGTGKTFLLNCIMEYFESQSESVIAVASTGVVALLMPKGQTAHSDFKIPVKISPEVYCNFTGKDKVGLCLFQTTLIVWDKAAAMHRYAIEAVDRSLRDLMKVDLPFGGKTVIFSGDFCQTLPVVKSGVYPRSEEATLKSSKLWSGVSISTLADNVRLGIRLQLSVDNRNVEFANELLQIGEGLKQGRDHDRISLNCIQVDYQAKAKLCFTQGIRACYSELSQMWGQNFKSYAKYLGECIILTPLNKDAITINARMLRNIKSEGIISKSIDKPDDNAPDALSIEALNAVDFPGFPLHTLELKVGAPIVLLRNLGINQGLCNGTRIVVKGLSQKAISGCILTGPYKNQEVLIPKITLYHEGDSAVKVPFYRYQFPVGLAFSMTINKFQGQSMSRVSVVLKDQVFAHGQLYVALSRVKNVKELFVTQVGTDPSLVNVVVKHIFNKKEAKSDDVSDMALD
jgi:hypothetical protein